MTGYWREQKHEYEPSTELVNLKTNASLSHNGTQIKGDSIITTYVMKAEAKGDNQSTQKRIQLVILRHLLMIQNLKANNYNDKISGT